MSSAPQRHVAELRRLEDMVTATMSEPSLALTPTLLPTPTLTLTLTLTPNLGGGGDVRSLRRGPRPRATGGGK